MVKYSSNMRVFWRKGTALYSLNPPVGYGLSELQAQCYPPAPPHGIPCTLYSGLWD